MMRYEKLTKEHYHNIKPNAHLSREYHDTTSETINMIVDLPNQWAGLNENGEVVVIYGVVDKWKDSAFIWSILSDISGKYMISLVKEAKRTLKELTYPRLEAQVASEFKQGVRLMEVLGFEKGGLLRKYDQYSRDCYMFSRVL